ncbi:MAG: glycosyltransferase family 2 protein, partial [Psychromonas sp.]
MLETAILVLLYNKEMKDSSTLNSLMKSTVQYSKAKIVIWNNGPKKLDITACPELSHLGYQIEVVETISNDSLAVIYNRFIKANSAKKYILLDDDSELSEEFISASANSQPEHLSLPVITNNGKV